FGLQAVVGDDPRPIGHARVARDDLPRDGAADDRMYAIGPDNDVAGRGMPANEVGDGSRGGLFDMNAFESEMHGIGAHGVDEEGLQVGAADGVDRGTELAPQVPDGHLGERFAPARPRHDVLKAVPDPLQSLPESERDQDLDAVGPQNDAGPGRAERGLALV